MVPTIPLSVWEQIPVIVVFAILLACVAYFMVKMFSKAIADINKHYAEIISNNNAQWQTYFDARSESDRLVSGQIVKQMEGLTKVVGELVSNFELHDQMERQALDMMIKAKPKLVKKNRNA